MTTVPPTLRLKMMSILETSLTASYSPPILAIAFEYFSNKPLL